MAIVQSSDLDCAKWFGKVKGDVYEDLDVVFKTFNVEVEWWNTIETT